MSNFKIGILGSGRGIDLARYFKMLGCDIVALCDDNDDRIKMGAERWQEPIALYTDFDQFLEHDMDAVVLANNFHEHAPFAIQCFRAGLHVFCECLSNGTMAEGVALIRAFEQSNSIYMLDENYPRMPFNREAKRIAEGGTLGKIVYAEGEYNHPVSPDDAYFQNRHLYLEKHWRKFLPRTYYITHSLGPVMWVTGATPRRVSAFAAFAPEGDAFSAFCGDTVAEILTHNDDGSIFRITGLAAYGGRHDSYRFCGTRGQFENVRGMGNHVTLRYNEWQIPEGAKEFSLYEPCIPDKDDEFLAQSGHGGGDFLTVRAFVECLEQNRQPEHPFDIYSAVNMSSVAILSHRSVLEGGVPYDIPDFHDERERVKYENDRLSPFYGSDGSEPSVRCCSRADFVPGK